MTKYILLISFMLSITLNGYGQSQALNNVDRYLSTYLDKTPVPGFSIVIVEGNKVLFQKGYGVVKEGEKRSMSPQSILPIGALGRGFTAMAILQLADAGKLDLDEPITTYIPWFRTSNKDFSDQITLRMCLSNTTGIPPQYESMPSLDNQKALEEFIRSFEQHVIKRKPGISHEFCDEGYSIAGYIIRLVSGIPYADYIKQNILDPLQMKRSSAGYNDLSDVVLGHEMDLHNCRPAVVTEPDPNYAAAGSQFYSTVEDLGHYMIALLNDGKYQGVQVLSAQRTNELFTPNTSFEGLGTMLGGNGIDIQYALGWMGMEIEQREILIHTGGNGRTGSIMGINRSKNQAFAMLFNADVNLMDRFEYPGMENTVNNVIHLLNAEDTTDFGVVRSNLITEEDYDLPQELWDKYVGHYESFGKQNPLFRDRTLEIKNIDNQYLELTVHQQLDFKGRYKLDFTNESRAVLRNISQPRTIQFSIYPDGYVGGVFMFGSEFKKRTQKEQALYTKIKSTDGTGQYHIPSDLKYTYKNDVLYGESQSGQKINISLHPLGKANFDHLINTELEGANISSKGIINKTRVKKGIWTEQTLFVSGNNGLEQYLFALYQDPISEKEMHVIITQPYGAFSDYTVSIIQNLQRSITF